MIGGKLRCGVQRCRRVAKIRIGDYGLCAGHLDRLSLMTPDLSDSVTVRSWKAAEARRVTARAQRRDDGGTARTR